MSKLNKDILFLFFEELQDDSNSLFSCLLVNRLWCETIIPILWRNPWCYIDHRKTNSLYYVITFYLSDDIKEFLTRQGVQLPLISQPLLFDYLSFCKSMNIRSVDKYVFTCINDAETSSDFNRFLLRKEVYNLFIRKCPELKYMDMRSIEHQIFYSPEVLNSLCELKCDTSINSIYFYELAYNCNSIEKLIIVNNVIRYNHGITKLIEVQKNLKYFEWEDDHDDDYDKDTYKEIFLALTKKAHTLTHFITSFVWEFEDTFPPNILSELRNLRALKLDFLFSYDYKEQLINSAYPNLEILQLGDFSCINMVTCIIKNSGGHLRKILINTYNIYDDFSVKSLNLIVAIYENCPLVEYLSLAFPLSKGHYIEFEKLLKACQKLRILSLDLGELFFNDEKTNYLVLKVLNQSPITLREIRFLNYFKFSLESLEEFLENWRGRPALSILYTGKHNEVYTEIINRYKNDNVLIDFRPVNKKDISISY